MQATGKSPARRPAVHAAANGTGKAPRSGECRPQENRGHGGRRYARRGIRAERPRVQGNAGYKKIGGTEADRTRGGEWDRKGPAFRGTRATRKSAARRPAVRTAGNLRGKAPRSGERGLQENRRHGGQRYARRGIRAERPRVQGNAGYRKIDGTERARSPRRRRGVWGARYSW